MGRQCAHCRLSHQSGCPSRVSGSAPANDQGCHSPAGITWGGHMWRRCHEHGGCHLPAPPTGAPSRCSAIRVGSTGFLQWSHFPLPLQNIIGKFKFLLVSRTVGNISHTVGNIDSCSRSRDNIISSEREHPRGFKPRQGLPYQLRGDLLHDWDGNLPAH